MSIMVSFLYSLSETLFLTCIICALILFNDLMYISDRPLWDLGEHPFICFTFVILINVFHYVEVMTQFEGGSFALPP